MPTKTSARPRTAQPSAVGTRRFSRSAATPPPRASRLPSRTPATTPRFRGKKKPAKATGLAGLLSALPITGAGKAAKSSGGGKAKPAFALLAAGAGAFLGRKQLRKRKDDGFTPAPPAPEVYTAPPAAAGGEAPLRPPAA